MIRPCSRKSGCRAAQYRNVRSTDASRLHRTGGERLADAVALRSCNLAGVVERWPKRQEHSGGEGMSRALAVFHGRFGRATVYQLNRPFNIHAHREGHLIFHVGGMPAYIDVSEGQYDLTETSVVAVNPWEPHNFLPSD